ncbi:carboxypeptidase regulatory-like domain-containing protein [Paenibacillus daejeonensis]|uniref:carboxypeptidase regulatory-like domain-containing protein n=1 Tax=Paenibacillus daejeonensis TaxID=135193 RepID=UPI0003A9E2AF|nr:carboxypeptidase regulatory-like domain-containing protein [Paenibacillus daejeonensis]
MKRLNAKFLPILLVFALLIGLLPEPTIRAVSSEGLFPMLPPDESITISEQVLQGDTAMLSDLAPPELEEAPAYITASPYVIRGRAPLGSEVTLTMRWADGMRYSYRGSASEPVSGQPDWGAFAIPVGFTDQGVHEWSAYAELEGLRSADSVVRRTNFDSVAPNAPFSVRISEGEPNQLVLEWEQPLVEGPGGEAIPDDSVVHYTLTRNGEPAATTSDLFYIDSGLEEMTFYRYEVRAVDAAGNVSSPYPAEAATFHRNAELIARIQDGESYQLQKPVMSKDGGTLAFVSDAPDLPDASEEGKPGIYVYRSSDTSISRIDDTNLYTERITRKLAVSRGGRYLAYIKHDGLPGQENVHLYDHTTREITAVTEASVGAILDLSMSDDGARLAFVSDADGIVPGDEDGSLDVFLYTLSGGDIRRLPKTDNTGRMLEDPGAAVLSGDGKQLFFHARRASEPGGSGYSNWEAFVYDVASGEIKPLGIELGSGEPLFVTQISPSYDGRHLALIASQGLQPRRAYIHDREAGTTVPVYAAGGLPGDVSVSRAELDDAGRYVLLHYTNRNSVNDPAAGPFNSRVGVIRFDWRTQEFRYVGNRSRETVEASIGGDGERAAFLVYKSLYTVCLAEECPDTPPPGPGISRVLVSVQSPVNGHIPLEGKLTVAAFGPPDGELAAVIGYRDHTGESQESRLPLPETAGGAGVYRETWQLPPHVRMITSLRVESVSDPQVRLDVEEGLLPIRVAGELEAVLTSAHREGLTGAYITVQSPSNKGAAGTVIDGRDRYRLSLPEGDDYRLRIVSLQGTLLQESGPVAIVGGERVAAEVTAEPVASLAVRLELPTGAVLRAAEVVFVHSDSGERIRTKADLNGNYVLPGVHYAGAQWRIETTVQEPYATPPADQITLLPGSNVRVYPMRLQPDGAVQGVVTTMDGSPVAGAQVKLLRSSEGEVAIARTDEDGKYRVAAPRGSYKLTVVPAVPPFNVDASAVIDLVPGVEKNQDFSLVPLERARINLNVVQKRLQEDWMRIPIKDVTAYNSYAMTVTGTNGRYSSWLNVKENAVIVDGKPGDGLRVCIDGAAFGMTASCVNEVLDDYNEASVRLEIEEKARISGSVASYRPGDNITLITQIYNEGWRTVSRKSQIATSGHFEIPLPDTGRIRLQIRRTVASVMTTTTVEREVGDGEILNLGSVELRDAGDLFYGLEGNGLDVRGEALPGESVSVHGSYRLQPRPARTLQDARLRIEVPAGAELITGSVVKDAVPVEPVSVSEHIYEVPIGTLTAGDGGSISYRVRLDPDLSRAVDPSLHIAYRSSSEAALIEELIGSARVVPVRITLTAPERSSRALIQVSGRAPAGSEVTVYAGGVESGLARASSGGLWRTEIVLPERGDAPLWGEEATHRLVAVAASNGGYTSSNAAYVAFDPRLPVMTGISMRQTDGREYHFDPGEGVARFPFVVVPYKDIRFRIHFDHPERVTNVRVAFDHQSYGAYYLSKEGHYESYVRLGSGLSSPVYVTYDVIPPTLPPAPAVVSDEAAQAAAARLPAAWSKASYAILDDEEAVEALGLEAVKPAGPGEYRSRVIRTTMGNPEGYVGYTQLTATRTRGASGSRPYRDVATEMEATDKGLRLTMRATFDAAFLSGEAAGRISADSARNKDDVDQVVIALSTLYPTSGAIGALDIANNLRSYVTDMDDFFDYAEELLKFQDEIAYTECHAPSRQHYHEMTELLYQRAQNGLVIKNGITGISLITSAIGTVPAWLGFSSSQVLLNLGSAAKNAWHDRLNELKADFKENQAWRDTMAGAGAIDRCRTPKDEEQRDERGERRERPDKVADPVWIWDPSGYVYEAVPSNRLEGVKAVLYELNTDTGEWLQWDAEWYLQQNPLHTDQEGRYGWDVPEGIWQVRYEKDGYEPAESAELTVLPPHFDVNIPMVSRKPPTVAYAAGDDAPSVEIAFSKPMLANSLHTGVILLADEEGLPVAGSITAVSPEPMADGRTVASRFVFEPGQTLAAGATYRLTVLPEVLSYADVPMTSPFETKLLIRAAGAPPTEQVQEMELVPGVREMIVKWQSAESPEAGAVRLYWRQADGEFHGPFEQMAGEGFYVLNGLEPGSRYEVRLATAGRNGAESVGVTMIGETLEEPEFEVDQVPPGEVSGLVVQRAGAQALQLAWRDPADADLRSVRIAWRAKGEREYGNAVSVPAGRQGLRIDSLSVNTDYEVLVSTVDRRMNRSDGLAAQGSTKQPAEPPPPGGPPPGPVPGGPPPGEKPGPDPQVPPPGAGSADEEVQVGRAASTWSGFDGSIALEIVANTFADGQRLRIRRLQDTEAPIPSGMLVYSDAFRIEAERIREFGRQLRLLLAYDEKQAQGLDLRKLSLFRYEEGSRSWSYIGGVKDAGGQRIAAEIRQPGVYAILSAKTTFADLQGHWARESIEVLAGRTIVNGRRPDRFEPSGMLTRAELAKLLLVMNGGAAMAVNGNHGHDRRVGAGPNAAQAFADVPSHAWYASYVNEAAAAGWMQGSGTAFRPDDWVSRQELAAVFVRLLGLEDRAVIAMREMQNSGAIPGFKDGQAVASWAVGYVETARLAGLMKGDTDSAFRPLSGATRAEAVILLLRAMEQLGLVDQAL